ncbi:MAG: SDR family NAD(P)-dependent oxidoreductase [Hyphomicrobiaceae bacterium]
MSRYRGTPFDLTGRAALVTGASSGLGREFARVLATAGAKVALAARRLDRLKAVAEEIAAAGGTALPVVMDVTDSRSVADGFRDAEASLGPVTIAIANAGVPSNGSVAEMSDDDWRSVLDINLDGVFRVVREAARGMKRHGTGGSIIATSSVVGHAVLPTLSAYAASKAAVVALTRTAALELVRDGIRVNAIAPGYYKTELNDAFLESPAGQKLISKVPMRRLGEPAELEGPILLLASDAGGFMTGTTLFVDGGAMLSIS